MKKTYLLVAAIASIMAVASCGQKAETKKCDAAASDSVCTKVDSTCAKADSTCCVKADSTCAAADSVCVKADTVAAE